MHNFLDYDDNWLTQHKARFTAMEIWQQPDLWEALGDELAQAQPIWQAFLTPLLNQSGLRIILSGAGSSAFVGRALAPWLREQSGYDVHAWCTTDIVATPRKYLDTARPTLLISFGRSGDSPESVAAVELASQIIPDCHHLIIACNPDSQLGRYAQQNTQRALMLTMPEGSHDQSFAMTSSFSCMLLAVLRHTGFAIPAFVGVDAACREDAVALPAGADVLWLDDAAPHAAAAQLEAAAQSYQQALLPPFFDTLTRYVAMGNSTFACPGHQGGQFFRKHPAGRAFFDFFGENVFRADMCNADVKLGDLLIHEGSAKEAQKFAAKVFNADKTYFVLNGTSSANKVVTNALLTRGDLVLFDRNNHKSVHHDALLQAGATPVYLETARNPFGLIGGIDAHCFDDAYLRQRVAEVAPQWAADERQFRLAVIQLGTYDGTIYNARQVVDKIGHLCDYILFDSAWVGYEQFTPMMEQCSPLLLALNENDPGIFVTQSVHKQQAGFSQTSQIHKKDTHIKGQKRFCNHKRFNNAYMLHASTSPFYPLFAALEINAKIHEGSSGRRMWMDCVKLGIETRKLLLAECRLIRPFVPDRVDGRPWQDHATEDMAHEKLFFNFVPGERWHGFDGYTRDQYFVEPCKLLLTTPGIDAVSGRYTAFGIPATILATYLRENGIVPEKCDLNSILFLLTPAEDAAKMRRLVDALVQFECCIEEDAPLETVLPSICEKYPGRYQGYTLRRLCQEMHDLYVSFDAKQLQREMFRQSYLPRMAMNPQEANMAFVRGEIELLPLSQAEGRIAAEGALPYPPGVLCVVPGEVWGGPAWRYFLALEEGLNQLPGFQPELQGVYIQQDACGTRRLYGHVVCR